MAAKGYLLGTCKVWPDLNCIEINGERRNLEGQAMQVLLVLLERPDDVISLSEILQSAWPGRVVEENSVHRRISQIRKTLGDNPQSPRYIANVPRRGYRLLIRPQIVVMEDDQSSASQFASDHGSTSTEARQEPNDSAEVFTPEATRLNWLMRLNRRIFVGDAKLDYLTLCLIGAIPIAAAPLIGIWEPRTIPSVSDLGAVCPLGPHLEVTLGFSQRWNWLMYPLVLPAWLLFARVMFRRIFGVSADSPLRDPRYQPFEARLRTLINDWRPVTGVLVVNIALTALDQSDVLQRFVDVSKTCPSGIMDWGWYGFIFPDVSVSHIALFTLWTTGEQMLFTQLALTTSVYVFAFNRVFMQTVFIRSRDQVARSKFVLNFDDPDLRFGLRRLSTIFDAQVFFCSIGGAVLLVERYFNTRLERVEELGKQILCYAGVLHDECPNLDSFTENLSWLMQDTVQVFIVACYVGFFSIILWTSNVKLLPLRRLGDNPGRYEYLSDFIPTGSRQHELLDKNQFEELDGLAQKFRGHNFWPMGDRRALLALRICLFLGLIMLMPLVPNKLSSVLLLMTFAVIAWFGASCFFAVQKHLLARVDESLVK